MSRSFLSKACSLLLAVAVFLASFMIAPPQAKAQTSFKVLNYLYSISGNHTIAGQQGSGYMNGLQTISGKYPGLWGEDFSFVIDSTIGGSSMADFRIRLAAEAKTRWARGEVINLMWHACPPTQAEPCAWDGGVVSHLSDTQWTQLITPGTSLYNAWMARVDAIVPALQDLENNGVEVLFRPFHEMNQGVFW